MKEFGSQETTNFPLKQQLHHQFLFVPSPFKKGT